jgi:hypothetical protein
VVKFEDKYDRRKWKKVEAGKFVVLGGDEWEVVEHQVKKSGVVVKLKGKPGVFTRKVDADKKVDVVKEFSLGEFARAELAKTRARRESTAHKAAPEFNPDPWRVDPADTLHAKLTGGEHAPGDPWKKPQDQAEANVTAILGAKMLGVQTEAGGVYAVPPVDPSTLKSHLFLMHNIQAGGRSHKALKDEHDAEHTRDIADLFVPHHHTKTRPRT